jgi:hypothetical protein
MPAVSTADENHLNTTSFQGSSPIYGCIRKFGVSKRFVAVLDDDNDNKRAPIVGNFACRVSRPQVPRMQLHSEI